MKAEELRAEELRIGNLVKDIDGNIFNIKQENLCDFANGFIVVKPIPLTEDWLLKFGFDKNVQDEIMYVFKNFKISIESELFIHYSMYSNHARFQYVHQLQNLHFALSGKELIIK